MMLTKIDRQNRIVERQVRESLGQDDPEGDDSMLSIGNETHYHYEGGAQQNPASASNAGGALSSLYPAAVAAALVGGPAATWWAMQPTDHPEAPAVVAPAEAADRDTLTDILPGFGTPEYLE